MQTDAMTPDAVSIGRVRAPRQFAQLAVMLLDGSSSMTEPTAGGISKADSVNGAIREMLTRFKAGTMIGNFTFSVITFDQGADVRVPPVDGQDIDDNADYNPLNGHGGGTSIFAALEKAEPLIQDFIDSAPVDGVHHSAVVLLMSDGECSDPAKTKAIADRLKQRYGERVTIAAALFSTLGQRDARGEGLLKSIATDPVRYYKTVYDGETLRAFFIASASSASGGVRI